MIKDAVADHNLLTDLTVGQLLAMIGTLAVIIGLIRKVGPILHRLNNLLDDWFGEEERPGVPARPGVMPRLAEDHEMLIAQGKAIEAQDAVMKEQTETMSHLRKKIEPLVDETAAGNHKEVLKKLDEIGAISHRSASHLNVLERLLNRHIRESKALMAEVKTRAEGTDFEVPDWPDMPDEDNPKKN